MTNHQTILRKVQIEDIESVRLLQKRFGLEPDSHDNWARMWEQHPWRDEGVPMGWVLENDLEIVGFLANIPLKYDLGGRPITVFTAAGWVVDPLYRNDSLAFLYEFLKQNNIDVILFTTNNSGTTKIWESFGAIPLPDESYREKLYWIIQSRSLFVSFLIAAGMKQWFARLAGLLLASIYFIKQLLDQHFIDNRLRHNQHDYKWKRFLPHELSDDFQKFWLRKVEEKRRFLASREPRILSWHFSNKDKPVFVLGIFRNNELCGYVALRRLGKEIGETSKYQVIDLMALDDQASVVELLLLKAHQVARDDRIDLLELTGFPENIRKVARGIGAHRRKKLSQPFVYKVMSGSKVNGDELSRNALWYPSLYDGDSSL